MSQPLLRMMASFSLPQAEGATHAHDRAEEHEDEEECCAICLEGLLEEGGCAGAGTPKQALVCSHAFHSECLGAWVETCERKGWDRSCPICREIA